MVVSSSKKSFSGVFIIYNPNSTGDSETMAQELRVGLKAKLGIPIKLIATEHAGHGEELAHDLVIKQTKPLIISASGDGGYHEVINGVLRPSKKAKNPICAVLPAGNANDHARAMHNRPLQEAIVSGNVTKIDVLKVTITDPSAKTLVRYAHSYVGIGFTATIAVELNKHSLNALKEASLVIKKFYKYRPFKIIKDDAVVKLDSLIFSNINTMAKVMKFSKDNKPNDGLFEVTSFPYKKKLNLVKKLVKSSTTGLDTKRRQKKYVFTTVKGMPMQLDGEILRLKAGSRVEIVCMHKALSTVF